MFVYRKKYPPFRYMIYPFLIICIVDLELCFYLSEYFLYGTILNLFVPIYHNPTAIMFISAPLLHLPTSSPSPSPLLHGAPSPTTSFPKLPSSTASPSASPPPPSSTIHAMNKLQGCMVCATKDKTVAVTRLAPHPKYKPHCRIKKKYQAHDPENQFEVGDFMQLEKSWPISKMKTFLAIPVIAKNVPRGSTVVLERLGIPLESEQEQSSSM